MGEIIGLIVVGLIVGYVARLLMPGADPMGLIGTLLLGVVGVFGGFYLARVIFPDNEGWPWIAAVIVAMALLWIFRRMSVGRGTTV
ncbi:MAG: GlsB/YeaQ/YmgE family stress response membrane protein [Actinomycetota bacterium]